MEFNSELLTFEKIIPESNTPYYNILYHGKLLTLELKNCTVYKQLLDKNIIYLNIHEPSHISQLKDLEATIIKYVGNNSCNLFTKDIPHENIPNLFFSNLSEINNSCVLVLKNTESMQENLVYTIKLEFSGV